ncbi:MAG TPA: carboxypeptidase-like regulatory domain-containing protein [Bryobacteraceae bacterium]|nr:carboxypeptidase-like regulatory domain-containing protein [Bryobacteraceae bacterium]
MQVRGSAIFAALVAVVLLLSPVGALSQGKKGEDANVRSVEGVVENPQGAPVDGAVVQLKNAKTLQVRSFITQNAGAYYFHGLSPDVDYELRAEYRGLSSPVRRLSVFDSRKKAIVNLKLESQQ